MSSENDEMYAPGTVNCVLTNVPSVEIHLPLNPSALQLLQEELRVRRDLPGERHGFRVLGHGLLSPAT